MWNISISDLWFSLLSSLLVSSILHLHGIERPKLSSWRDKIFSSYTEMCKWLTGYCAPRRKTSPMAVPTGLISEAPSTSKLSHEKKSPVIPSPASSVVGYPNVVPSYRWSTTPSQQSTSSLSPAIGSGGLQEGSDNRFVKFFLRG